MILELILIFIYDPNSLIYNYVRLIYSILLKKICQSQFLIARKYAIVQQTPQKLKCSIHSKKKQGFQGNYGFCNKLLI